MHCFEFPFLQEILYVTETAFTIFLWMVNNEPMLSRNPMGHLRENISFMSLFVLEKPKHIERFCSNFLRCCEHMFGLTKKALPRLLVLARFCLTLLGFSDYH